MSSYDAFSKRRRFLSAAINSKTTAVNDGEDAMSKPCFANFNLTTVQGSTSTPNAATPEHNSCATTLRLDESDAASHSAAVRPDAATVAVRFDSADAASRSAAVRVDADDAAAHGAAVTDYATLDGATVNESIGMSYEHFMELRKLHSFADECSWFTKTVSAMHSLKGYMGALLLGAFVVSGSPVLCDEALADSALDEIIALGGDETSLSKQDIEILKALEASTKSGSKKSAVSRPVVHKPGEVRFVYGASRPTIVCSLLHVCDIALEPGESVVDVQSGDSARWVVGRSAHGTPQGMVEHVTIKPTDIGLESNLTIYTDKRSYSMDIKSSAKDYMPSVSFIYTEQSMERYQKVKEELLRRQRYNSLTLDGNEDVYLDDTMDDAAIISSNAAMPRGVRTSKGAKGVALLSGLDFDYQVTGDKEVIPLRVFNDGKHTYVQMPQKLMEGMLPALVEVTQTHVFADDATAVTNYRINGNNFIVDGIPRHLRLFIGNKDSGRALSADIVRNS